MKHARWHVTTLAIAFAAVLAQCVQFGSALPEARGGCGFDTVKRHSGPLPVTVERGVPSKSRNTFQVQAMSDETQWAPLRIKRFLQSPDKESIVCNSGTGHHNITNMFGQTVSCIPESDMSRYDHRAFQKILRAAVKLHTERLLVQPTEGPIAVPSLQDVEVCKHFGVPESHQNTGVSDADMVLYVAPTPMKRTAPFVYETCATNSQGRPTVGVVALDLLSFMDFGLHRASVRFLAHAIAHTLGFSYNVMKEKDMIENKEIRGQQDAPIMVSPKVKQAAQKHYGCNTLDGMEMKNRKGLESHWKRRNALDELMSLPLPRPGDSFLGLYTELTLSAFEDLGYYKAKFEMAEPMKWGRNAGCEFMTYVCKESTENMFPAMFCNPNNERDIYKCSSDRASFGVCSSNSVLTVDALWTEFCPIVKAKTRCDKAPKNKMPGHLFGAKSWCVDAQSLSIASSDTGRTDSIDGVCAEIECGNGTVRVRYAGASDFTPCPEGTSIQVTSDVLTSGSIVCPKYDEVCTVGFGGQSLLARNGRSTSGRE